MGPRRLRRSAPDGRVIFRRRDQGNQRHKLGKLLGTRTRNLLLMSATPHNGKKADFQPFMGQLDADRFEGRFREGVHKADVSEMMRRLTNEELYRFDGTPCSRSAVPTRRAIRSRLKRRTFMKRRSESHTSRTTTISSAQ